MQSSPKIITKVQSSEACRSSELKPKQKMENLASSPHYSSDRPDIILALKICIGVTSALSIIGGFLIVLTFCLRLCFTSDQQAGSDAAQPGAGRRSHYKAAEMMSPARVILVNLSIADILLAGSHLWGVVGNYQKHYHVNQNANNSGPNGSTDLLCDIQGGLAVYSTIASFLWTIILSFFVVGTLVLSHPKRYGSLFAVLVYLVVCWGLPAVVLIVISVEREFGFEDDTSVGECSHFFSWNHSFLYPGSLHVHV